MIPEQRRFRRYPVEGHDAATVEIDGRQHLSRLLNVSANGFRIALAHEPTVELGQVVLLRTSTGSHYAQIVNSHLKNGELQLGLRRTKTLTRRRRSW